VNARAGSTNRASEFRGENDFYPTPPGATWALCNLGILPKLVWEPACGDGSMANVLHAAGHAVVATDLIDRGHGYSPVDFLRCPWLLAPAIVTNPPFNLADEFVEHALALRAPIIAMFLRLKYLEGFKRHQRIHSRAPLASVLVFKERVKFFSGDADIADQPGWNTEAFAWFIWRQGHNAEPTIGWLSRDSGPQGTTA